MSEESPAVAEAEPGEAEDASSPADGSPPDERSTPIDEGPVRTLDKRIRLKWFGQVLLGVAVLAAVVAGVVVFVDAAAPWMGAAVVVPVLVIGLVWVPFRYRAWAFQFRPDHLFLEHGVYRHVETVVPYVRIQHVDTSRGPIERALGLSTLVVYTAGSRGADVSIPGLPADDAEAMQTRVKELAIESEGGEGL